MIQKKFRWRPIQEFCWLSMPIPGTIGPTQSEEMSLVLKDRAQNRLKISLGHNIKKEHLGHNIFTIPNGFLTHYPILFSICCHQTHFTGSV